MATTPHALSYALASSLTAHLQDKMIDNIPASDITTMLTYIDSESASRVFAPSLIKLGRFQDDPTTLSGDAVIPSAFIAVHFHDPDDLGDGWKDSIASPVESMTNAGYRFPTVHEIGGGSEWWRRLRLEFAAFYIDANLAQTEAARLTCALKHLLELYSNSYLSDENPHGWDCALTDPIGETASLSQVVKSHGWEGGGPDDDYLWKGGVWLQVKTHKRG